MKLKKIDKDIAALEEAIISNNDKEGFYGDGISIADIPEIPIESSFADQIYIRKMTMKADQLIVGAIIDNGLSLFLAFICLIFSTASLFSALQPKP